MKKTLGRVVASMSAVALLAGGLVGVAVPANADVLGDTTGLEVCVESEQFDVEQVGKEMCEARTLSYRGYTIDDKNFYVYWGERTAITEELGGNERYCGTDDAGRPNLFFEESHDAADGCKTQGLYEASMKKFALNKDGEFEQKYTPVGTPPTYVCDDDGLYITCTAEPREGFNAVDCVAALTAYAGFDQDTAVPRDDSCVGQLIQVGNCNPGFEEDEYGNCVPTDGSGSQGCDDGFEPDENGDCVPTDGSGSQGCDGDEVYVEDLGECVVSEPVQKTPPPPPPCWSAEALNNCPVGGALRFVAPKYAMVGVPVKMYAYASWRPDANSPAQPTNGSAVIRVDGEDYSGVEFKDGVAEWRFIPETEGVKEFTASGVLFSGLSGANAYIDTVPARTYVLEYDPAAYATALKKKAVEVGDTYVITDPNQARSYAEDRYEWSVSDKSDDVCAVYETKKGAVKAKFTDSGKCTVIWLDKESGDSGKYTFIAKK